jgi:hypothetical protein
MDPYAKNVGEISQWITQMRVSQRSSHAKKMEKSCPTITKRLQALKQELEGTSYLDFL